MEIKFSKDFLFGGSINGEQCEGLGVTPKAKTIWNKFYEEHPQSFYNGVGPIYLNNFQEHYQTDIALMAAAGIKIIRFPLQWSRLMDQNNNPCYENINYYHNLFKEFKKHKIKIISPLFGFDTPLWFQEIGGFEKTANIEQFLKYAQFAIQEYQNDVDYFVTFIEPTPMVLGGYLEGFHWPLKNDLKLAVQVGYNIILTHAKVVQWIRSNQLQAKIGAIFNNPVSYPRDVNNSDDVEATKIADALINRSFTDAMIAGEFSDLLINFLKDNNLLPLTTEKDLQIIKNIRVDFLGINYYQPYRFQTKLQHPEGPVMPNHFFDYYVNTTGRFNTDRGWEIYPRGLYDAVQYVSEKYPDLPFFITENGIAISDEERFIGSDGMIHDEYRIAFYKEHLYWLHKAIDDFGANCKGYLIWSPIDNWSWLNGYKNRYGLIGINLNNQNRYFKQSAMFYKKLSEEKSFKWDAQQELCDLILDQKIKSLANQ